MSDTKFAIYIVVVEDTSKNADKVNDLPASNVDSILDIETEAEAIALAQHMREIGDVLA